MANKKRELTNDELKIIDHSVGYCMCGAVEVRWVITDTMLIRKCGVCGSIKEQHKRVQ